MQNPIIKALAPHISDSTPRPLSLASFAAPNGSSKQLGVILGVRDENGVMTEIAAYRLSPDEEHRFGEYVDDARAWLEAPTGGVPA